LFEIGARVGRFEVKPRHIGEKLGERTLGSQVELLFWEKPMPPNLLAWPDQILPSGQYGDSRTGALSTDKTERIWKDLVLSGLWTFNQ